jgi:hypothetical protein
MMVDACWKFAFLGGYSNAAWIMPRRASARSLEIFEGKSIIANLVFSDEIVITHPPLFHA